MAAESLETITEQWIRERFQLKHRCLGDVRSLRMPGTYGEKIRHLGMALKNFVRLKILDLSCNALVSVEGVRHLKMLEKLNLYYNRIPSVEEANVLCKLPVLKELDVRLNPLTRDPHYRLYLIHAMPTLRKLDDCPVRDTERNVAIMQFSCAPPPQQSSLSPKQATGKRSSDLRLASVENFTKKLSHMDPPDNIVLNFVAKSESKKQPLSGSSYKDRGSQNYLEKETEEREFKKVYEPFQRRSPKQETAKSILKDTQTKDSEIPSEVLLYTHNKPPTSSEVTERPRVSFGPDIENCSSVTGRPKKLQARGHFTPNPSKNRHTQPCSSPLMNIQPPSPRGSGLNLSDPSNPILHPARMSYTSSKRPAGGAAPPQKAGQKKRGSYRKPLEMLLNLVDKHWAGKRSLHENNNFLSQAVQILSMMENDISVREAEVETLTREVEALSRRAEKREEEHKIEIYGLSSQLEEAHSAAGKLNEQLRTVLEENVALQRQLIKLEQQYLKSMMKTSPIAQIKEAQIEVEALRREIEGLREKVHEAERVNELTNMLQESHRSLVVTNERLLGELQGTGDHE